MPVVYMDSARQLLADLAQDDRTHDCHMCVVAIVARGDINIEAISFDEDSPMPFQMVGLLDYLKSVVMRQHIDDCPT